MGRAGWVVVGLAALFPGILLPVMQSGCAHAEKAEVVSVVTIPPAADMPGVVEIEAGVPEAGVESWGDGGVRGKAGSAGDSRVIARCCAALMLNANSAPPELKGSYLAAVAACTGMLNLPITQATYARIRGPLAGAKMPAACQ